MNFLKSVVPPCFALATMAAILINLAPLPATAGSGDGVGNGGGAYVCRNPLRPNQITWAASVDLWEGASPQIHRLSIDKNSATSAKEQSQKAVKKLFTAHEFFYMQVNAALERVWIQIDQALKRGDTGTYLTIVPDSRDVLRPKYCPGDQEQRPEYEQVANFFSESDIRIDIQLFQSFETETDRAALATHEAIYEVLRKWENQRDSVKARKINAYLYSTQNKEVLIDLLKKELTGGLQPERIMSQVYRNQYWDALDNLEELKRLLDVKVWVHGKQVPLLPLNSKLMLEIFYDAPIELMYPVLQELLQRKPRDFDVNELLTSRLGASTFLLGANTFLSIAIDKKNHESVALLLQQPGIDPNRMVTSYKYGYDFLPHSPLMRAFWLEDLESVRILLEDPRVRDAVPSMNFRALLGRSWRSPISKAPLEVIQKIFETWKDSGLTINDTGSSRERPIEYAIERLMDSRDKGEYIRFVLSRPEYDPNLCTTDGWGSRSPLSQLFYQRERNVNVPEEVFHSVVMLMVRDPRLAMGATEDNIGPLAAIIDDFAEKFTPRSPIEESQKLEYVKAMIETHPGFDLRERIGRKKDISSSETVRETVIETAQRKGLATIQRYLEAELEKQENARPQPPESGFFEKAWKWFRGIFGG